MLQEREGLQANAPIKAVYNVINSYRGVNFNHKTSRTLTQRVFSTLVATALFVQCDQKQQQQINRKLRGDFFGLTLD